jgi:hypothetical protein
VVAFSQTLRTLGSMLLISGTLISNYFVFWSPVGPGDQKIMRPSPPPEINPALFYLA